MFQSLTETKCKSQSNVAAVFIPTVPNWYVLQKVIKTYFPTYLWDRSDSSNSDRRDSSNSNSSNIDNSNSDII
jgi:hypothetical protein